MVSSQQHHTAQAYTAPGLHTSSSTPDTTLPAFPPKTHASCSKPVVPNLAEGQKCAADPIFPSPHAAHALTNSDDEQAHDVIPPDRLKLEGRTGYTHALHTSPSRAPDPAFEISPSLAAAGFIVQAETTAAEHLSTDAEAMTEADYLAKWLDEGKQHFPSISGSLLGMFAAVGAAMHARLPARTLQALAASGVSTNPNEHVAQTVDGLAAAEPSGMPGFISSTAPSSVQELKNATGGPTHAAQQKPHLRKTTSLAQIYKQADPSNNSQIIRCAASHPNAAVMIVGSAAVCTHTSTSAAAPTATRQSVRQAASQVKVARAASALLCSLKDPVIRTANKRLSKSETDLAGCLLEFMGSDGQPVPARKQSPNCEEETCLEASHNFGHADKGNTHQRGTVPAVPAALQHVSPQKLQLRALSVGATQFSLHVPGNTQEDLRAMTSKSGQVEGLTAHQYQQNQQPQQQHIKARDWFDKKFHQACQEHQRQLMPPPPPRLPHKRQQQSSNESDKHQQLVSASVSDRVSRTSIHVSNLPLAPSASLRKSCAERWAVHQATKAGLQQALPSLRTSSQLQEEAVSEMSATNRAARIFMSGDGSATFAPQSRDALLRELEVSEELEEHARLRLDMSQRAVSQAEDTVALITNLELEKSKIDFDV